MLSVAIFCCFLNPQKCLNLISKCASVKVEKVDGGALVFKSLINIIEGGVWACYVTKSTVMLQNKLIKPCSHFMVLKGTYE